MNEIEPLIDWPARVEKLREAIKKIEHSKDAKWMRDVIRTALEADKPTVDPS